MKNTDRRHVVHEMIDFPKGKRDFRVRAWSGAFWEPWREKKDKPKCIYKMRAPSHRSKFRIFAKFRENFADFFS